MLKQFLIVLCLCFGISVLLLYVFQRRLIYFPTHKTPQLAIYHAPDMSVVTLRTQDNLTLNSWYKKPARNHCPTILILHGNAGHIGHRMPLARQLIEAGFGVFLLEYRGYGGNPGSPSEQGLYADAHAALEFLIQNDVKSEHIVVYGESLGTGVATQIAAENPICALILQSPFTSLVALSKYHYPWIILQPRDRFDSLGRIEKIHAPLLILHGNQDQLVPFSEGMTLYRHANEPKKIIEFDQHNHNDLGKASGFYDEIIHFVQENCNQTAN